MKLFPLHRDYLFLQTVKAEKNEEQIDIFKSDKQVLFFYFNQNWEFHICRQPKLIHWFQPFINLFFKSKPVLCFQ